MVMVGAQIWKTAETSVLGVSQPRLGVEALGRMPGPVAAAGHPHTEQAQGGMPASRSTLTTWTKACPSGANCRVHGQACVPLAGLRVALGDTLGQLRQLHAWLGTYSLGIQDSSGGHPGPGIPGCMHGSGGLAYVGKGFFSCSQAVCLWAWGVRTWEGLVYTMGTPHPLL